MLSGERIGASGPTRTEVEASVAERLRTGREMRNQIQDSVTGVALPVSILTDVVCLK
jgi:hypothetical protein